MSRLIKVRGNMYFQPKDINWSYRGLGIAARNSMKKQMNRNVLMKNQKIGGRKSGPSQPPKKIVVIIDEISINPRYSPTMNMPNFIPEYSV